MVNKRQLPMSGKDDKVETCNPLREASGNYAKCQDRTTNRTKKKFTSQTVRIVRFGTRGSKFITLSLRDFEAVLYFRIFRFRINRRFKTGRN